MQLGTATMVGTTSGALLGLVLGVRHAFEPDHLAAVSTLTLRVARPWHGALLGAVWGIGHTLALLCLGGGFVLAGRSMPSWLTRIIELGGALVMIGVGLTALYEAARTADPIHARRPTGRAAPHYERQPSRERWPWLSRRTLLLGLVHGLGGSGPLMALAAASIQGTTPRILYMALFGVGSVAGMAMLSGLLGWPAVYVHARPAIGRALALLAAVLSLSIGVVWLGAAVR